MRGLAEELRRAGVRVWLDQAELKVGDSLTRKIGTAIHEMDYFAVVLSKNSVDSEWVQRELQIALSRELAERKVVILPILLEEVEIPPFLRDKVYADFTSAEKAGESMPRLLKVLAEPDTHAGRVGEPPAPHPPGPRRNPNLVEDIKQILKTAAGESKFYLAPNVSNRLLKAAKRTCGVPDGAQVLAVMNFNHGFFWDVGKRAVVFTDEGVYYGNEWKGRFLPYSEFPECSFRCETRSQLSVHPRGGSVTYYILYFGEESIQFGGALFGANPFVLLRLLDLIKLLTERGGV